MDALLAEEERTWAGGVWEGAWVRRDGWALWKHLITNCHGSHCLIRHFLTGCMPACMATWLHGCTATPATAVVIVIMLHTHGASPSSHLHAGLDDVYWVSEDCRHR
jgi:hypothetical protein